MDGYDVARRIADAVLYEGYILNPYRATHGKNASGVRWQSGGLVPHDEGTSVPGGARPGRGIVSGAKEFPAPVYSETDEVSREPLRLDGVVVVAADGYRWGDGVALELAPVTVTSDRWSIERILVNLVENALRHGQVGVTVRVAAIGSQAVIEVSDRAPGIAEEDLAHLFDRFYTTARSRSGTGLGLAIVRQHADRIGAGLDVRTAPGQGTGITASFPDAVDAPGGSLEAARQPATG